MSVLVDAPPVISASQPISEGEVLIRGEELDSLAASLASLSASSDGVPTQDSESSPSPTPASPVSLPQELDCDFHPAIHLAPLDRPTEHIKMSELGHQPSFYSDIAASKPVPLFTLEAVRRIRAEVFGRATLANHLYSDQLNPCVLRGHCPERARFTYNALNHPEVQKRVNMMAGVDLTHVYNYEIGHTNIQLGPRGWSGLKADPDRLDSEGELASAKEISPIRFQGLNWHKDAYPFVQILMLSDLPTNCGGNTVVRKADGSLFVMELPKLGEAMMLQGGRLDHAVLPTTTTLERITMITSYRPADPLLPDTCTIDTVRCASDEKEVMRQWVEYRMKVLAARALKLAASVKTETSISDMAAFAAEQTAFLTESVRQMVTTDHRYSTGAREHYLLWLKEQELAAS